MIPARAQVTPQIVVADSVLCIPSKVDLTVINCSSCIKFEWQVGAGAAFKPTSINNFQTIITSPGWYDVTVIVHTSSGAKLAIGKKKAFFGRPAPTVKFTVNKTTFCKGRDTLILTDSSDKSVARDWLIDGNIYYNTAPQIKYLLNGSFGYKSVYILVTDSWGCKGGLLKDSMISVWDSVKAKLNPDVTSGCAPRFIQFNPTFDSASQRVVKFFWQFQGGVKDTSSLRKPPKVYYSKGDTFDVKLRITTHVGCVYRYEENNIISLGDTALMKITPSKNKICVSERITLSVTGNKTKKPVWTGWNVAYTADSSVGTKIKVKFNDTGLAYFKVTENDRGCISEATINPGIKVQGPLAKFISEYPYYCQIPKNLKFTNKSIEDKSGTSYKWDVSVNKGSSVSTATSLDHSYTTNSGTNYDVTLIATGNNGCADTLKMPMAAAFGKIDTNFTVKPNPACPGQMVQLIAKAKGTTGLSTVYYNWTFYDDKGNIVKRDNAVKGSHTYNTAGDYSAKLLIWNSEGCKDSLKLKDTIHIISYKAKLQVNDTLVCTNQPFTAIASGRTGLLAFKQQWELINIDSANAGHVYAHADTVQLYASKTGRWKLTYTLADTAANGCYSVITYPYYIKVSGINMSISGTPTFGCSPLPITLNGKINYNVNYEKNGGNVYAWKTRWPKPISIQDSTKISTAALVKKGMHQAWLVYTNASGCKDSTPQLTVTAGMNLNFSINGQSCTKRKLQVQNNSPAWVQSFRYECDSAGAIFSPSKTVRDPSVIFTKPGKYPIRLIGTYNGCNDTFTLDYEAHGIKADFTTPDSISFCAPKLINIFNLSKGAVYNKWRFGDGDTTITRFNEIAGHLYNKNSNAGYTVSLITSDAWGCSDTLVKTSFIKIIGPEPDFSLKNTRGCEPLRVEFINKSKVFNRMFMDYDNGVVYDTTLLTYYNYKVTDKSKNIQFFLPRLLLYDSFGCSALKISDDTVKVLKGPEPKFIFTSNNFLRKTEGCANDLLVKFANQSKFFIRTFWDFDNDWKTDITSQNNPSWFYTKPGIYYPSLVAENFNGCRDTFIGDSIVVWEAPVAGFNEATDSSCAIDPVRFKSAWVSKYKIVSHKWDFGEIPLYNDTSSVVNPIWKFKTPFDHNVTLDIEDQNGCKSQITKNIYIFDTAGPKKPELVYITVRNNRYVDCYWRKSNLGNFLQYHTYLDSIVYLKRFSSYLRTDTSLTWDYNNQVSNKRFCFTARIEDTCNQMGRFGSSHCTIVLRDTIFEPYNVTLNWLAYDWWGTDLSHYNVYRKDKINGTYQLIGTSKSNRQTYTDSFLCDQDYWYYVEAVHTNGLYRSQSNEVKSHPIYIKPQFTVNTTLVTVENNAYTRVKWERYPRYYRTFSYSLERSLTGNPGSFISFSNGPDLTDTDLGADINNRTVYYQVRFRDHCGVLSEPGVVSNSIWLRSASASRNNTSLEWTPYKWWSCGVREYNLQLKDQNGIFQNFKKVGPGVVKLDSLDIEKLGLDSICFRVYAIKDSVTNDTSMSNEMCLVPSSFVLVPNTFTPDENGLNEVFKPVAGFIHRHSLDPQARFEFLIFNRWGQQVFESSDADIGWNGTFKNNLCPPGMYIYTIKALGYDGVPHLLKGTVMLLR